MSFEIKTEIEINATASKVWDHLMDFQNYAKWNSFIKKIDGDPQIGNQIKAEIDGMKFKPTVLENKKNQEFRWIGRLLFKGLFDGEHRFEIEQIEEGKIRFIQSEKFRGLLVPLFKKKLKTDTVRGFENMNLELKGVSEAMK